MGLVTVSRYINPRAFLLSSWSKPNAILSNLRAIIRFFCIATGIQHAEITLCLTRTAMFRRQRTTIMPIPLWTCLVILNSDKITRQF